MFLFGYGRDSFYIGPGEAMRRCSKGNAVGYIERWCWTNIEREFLCYFLFIILYYFLCLGCYCKCCCVILCSAVIIIIQLVVASLPHYTRNR